VGIAGVSGNGQRELAEAIAGIRRSESGSIVLEGTELAGSTLPGSGSTLPGSGTVASATCPRSGCVTVSSPT
jgi:ABC-type uncharacterized transport system ATPase subunit